MAKKQTRRSISVSRTTYEKLKSFCETNGISMSQFVESRVGDFLGEPAGGENADRDPRPAVTPAAPRPRDLRSEEHTSELQSHHDLVCRLLLEKKKKKQQK